MKPKEFRLFGFIAEDFFSACSLLWIIVRNPSYVLMSLRSYFCFEQGLLKQVSFLGS